MIGELGDRIATLVQDNLVEIPDFPEPGVLFRDITGLFANGPAFKELVELIGARYAGRIDAVAGLESRGFILGAPVAAELGLGMLTIRKAGKLPGEVIGVDYSLEYGSARMEIRPQSVREGQRVLIIDDVLATGGTARAAVDLLNQCGASVEALAVLMELDGLNGRSKLDGVTVETALHVCATNSQRRAGPGIVTIPGPARSSLSLVHEQRRHDFRGRIARGRLPSALRPRVVRVPWTRDDPRD